MKFKLRPELDELKYWVHVFIIVVIISLSIIYLENIGMFLRITIGLVMGDIVSHTVLKLD